jgi:hypothetical protein
MTSTWYSCVLTASLALANQACLVEDDPGPTRVVIVSPPGTGTLTLEWSIAGRLSPSDCAAFGADFMELVVFDRSSTFATEAGAPCEGFALSLELPEGVFDAEATLVDRSDFAVSVSEPLDDLVILESSELVASVDYPPGSFL